MRPLRSPVPATTASEHELRLHALAVARRARPARRADALPALAAHAALAALARG